MATSGTHKINSGRDGGFLIFSWTRADYEITVDGINPTSTINWTMALTREWGDSWADSSKPYKVVVNGHTYSGSKGYDMDSGYQLIASGTDVITHNADGTGSFSYSFEFEISYGFLNLVTKNPKGSGTATLDTLPRPGILTEATNFTDEENPSISYKCVTGTLIADALEACISFTGSKDDIPYRSVIKKSDGSYIFTLTDEERTTLRAKIYNSVGPLKIFYYLRTTIEGTQYWSKLERTMTLVNYEPTLDPIVYDTYAPTKRLTGDNTKFIKYFSNAHYGSQASAKKEASIVYQYLINGAQKEEDEGGAGIHWSGRMNNVESNTFYFSATDSRGLTVRDAIVVDMVDYIKLTSALTLQPLTLAGNLTFILDGNCFVGSFGAYENSLEFACSVKKDGVFVVPDGSGGWREPTGEESGWFIFEPEVNYSGNAYTATYTLSGLDPNSIYTITGQVIDELMEIQTTDESVTSTPIFDWGKNDFQHNTAVYLTKNHSIRVEDDYYDKEVLNPLDENGYVRLGYGNYRESDGDTNIYGNNINLIARENITLNGTSIGSKVLWSGVSHVNGSQPIALSEPISQQLHGIVLVFSLYRYGYAEDVSINSFFVSKKEVELLPNAPHTFFMMINSGFSVIGSKYLNIADQLITGTDTNTSNSANSGITFNNSMFVLRYVIGV